MTKISSKLKILLVLCIALNSQTSVAENIVIGVISGLTGPGSSYGQGIVQGAQMAIDEINASGGINNKKLTLRIVDDTSEPARSAIVMRRLISSNPDVIVGGWGSSQVLAHMDFAEQSAIPYIVVGATNPRIITAIDKWIFRVIPSDEIIVGKLVDYLIRKGKKRIAVIHDRNAYGSSSSDIFLAALQRYNLEPAITQSYGTTDKKFQQQLARIKQSNPDSLVIFGTIPAAPLIMKEARAMKTTVPFYGTGGLINNYLISQAAEASEGTELFGFYHRELNDDVRAWHKRYLEIYADTANPNPSNAIWEYSAIKNIVAPCLAQNEYTPVSIRNCIANWKGRFTGANGETYINTDGQLETKPVAVKVHQGTFQLITNSLL